MTKGHRGCKVEGVSVRCNHDNKVFFSKSNSAHYFRWFILRQFLNGHSHTDLFVIWTYRDNRGFKIEKKFLSSFFPSRHNADQETSCVGVVDVGGGVNLIKWS